MNVIDKREFYILDYYSWYIFDLYFEIIIEYKFIAVYPTSSKKPKNWDKIAADVAAEEKDEKLEGDAALNKSFILIYYFLNISKSV